MTRRINGDALQNRDGTAVTGDVFVFDDAHVDGGEWQAPGAGSASAAWPVGSIFLSAVATDPATLLGFGTWSAIGAGRVLIGIDAGDVDFDTLGETGGAKTSAHAHGAGTLATSGGSWHSHGAGTIATVAESSHTHGVGTLATAGESAHTHGVGTLAPSAHSGTAVDTHSNHTHGKGSLAVTDPATGTNDHARHRHEITGILSHRHAITGGDFSHRHGMAEGTTDGAGTYMDRSNAAAATTAQTDFANLPDGYTQYEGSATLKTLSAELTSTSATWEALHNVDGNTATESPSLTHTVTQPAAHTMSGSTAAGSSHSHGVSGSTAAGSSHSHGVSGTTADEGAHTHSVGSGSTGSTASSTVQPYLVVAIWQRTA